jgi:hypothetical protein
MRAVGKSSARSPLVLAEQQHRPVEQVDRGWHVAARERAPAGGREQLRGPLAEPDSAIARRAKLEQQTSRLLDVIAENLLVLAGEVVRLSLDPIREPLVEFRAFCLRYPL